MNLQRNAHSLVRDVLRAAPFARLESSYPELTDLGLIGDRHTAAVISTNGDVLWYSPGRFDAPSLLGGLLDPALGGTWRVLLPGAAPGSRRYLDQSAVLETCLTHPCGPLVITDWMNLARPNVPHGLFCRRFSAAPDELRLVLAPRPHYGTRLPAFRRAAPNRVVIEERFHLHSSHPLAIHGTSLEARVPRGEPSWAVLSDGAVATPLTDADRLEHWLSSTRQGWSELAGKAGHYDGPWAEEVHASLRALRLLVYEATGAIASAVTTSLPEVIGGKRNYDYRFSWLRDAGMIVRALVRFEPDCEAVHRHISFVAKLHDSGYRRPLDPVSAVGGERVPMQQRLPLAGYKGSRPAFAGNKAARQLQLGSLANFLLGVQELYQHVEPRAHWPVVSATADFLADHWHERGHGIWEEPRGRSFTASKVFTVCALEGLARFAEDRAEAVRWCRAAQAIRDDVAQACHTADGAFAAISGEDGVDISAALFPVWGYCDAGDEAMQATVRALEQHYSPRPGLFHRHLQNTRAERREGAFLAGTFWMAHYWVRRGDLPRARHLIDLGVGWTNDLGLFPEEIDASTGRRLGNLPLGLVHASFLAAVADYRAATA